MSKYWKDLTERVLATAAEAGIAAIPVASLNLPGWTIIPITAALAAAKGWLAKFVAQPDSASLATDV